MVVVESGKVRTLSALKLIAISSLYGIGYTLVDTVNFSNTITTGAIISTLVVASVAGLFTIRSNIAKTWKESYEAEHTAKLNAEEECRKQSLEMLSEREQQQILRHELKNEIAALKLKTDLSAHELRESGRHEEIASTLDGIRHSMAEMATAMTLLTKEVVENGKS